MVKKFVKKEKRKYIEAYTNNYTGDVVLTYRDEKKRKCQDVIKEYAFKNWYFYITTVDYQKLLENGVAKALEDDGLGVLDYPVAFEAEGPAWIKVYVKNQGINEKYAQGKTDDRLKLKSLFDEDGIKIYEGDLKPHKRYCIDNAIEVADNFQVGYYDIETDDSNHGIVVGRDEILSIALWDQDGESYFWSVAESGSERAMLLDFYEFVRWKMDLLIGWNSDSFDKMYIIKRFEKHFLEDEARWFKNHLAHIDLMQVFIKRFSNDTKITSWSLDFISNYFLGDKKVENVEKGNGKLKQLFLNNYEKFKEYNIKDAKLLFDLNAKLGIVDQMILECQITGCFPSKYSISELLDTYILRSVRGQGIHFPSIEYGDNQIRCPVCNHIHTFEHSTDSITSMKCIACEHVFDPQETKEDITGAYVVDPETGIHDHVFTFDYKSLYPSIIITWNIGPDSYIEPEDFEQIQNHGTGDEMIKSANGQYFYKDHPSAITKAIKKLLDLRVKFKKVMLAAVPESREYDVANAKQRATKVLCNSMYGIMGYTRGRFYRREIAEAITLGGQWLNKKTKVWFEEKGYSVIYGDTDSVFVKMPEGDKAKIPGLLKELHSFYDIELKNEFNIDEHHIELEFEKHFKRLIMVQKKRYAGHIIEQDGAKLDKVLVKGLEYIKRDTIEYGRKMQKELIDSILYNDRNLPYYIDWVEKHSLKFFSGDFDIQDLVVTKKLTKRPESYKTKPVHVKVAEELRNREEQFYVGMRIPYIVVSEKPLEAVHPSWYEPGSASPTYYWDKQIYSICERILEACFKNYDWSQYTTKTQDRRKKKMDGYQKWLTDEKGMKGKKLEKRIKSITDCKIITSSQKKELLEKFNCGIQVVNKTKESDDGNGRRPRFKVKAKGQGGPEQTNDVRSETTTSKRVLKVARREHREVRFTDA